MITQSQPLSIDLHVNLVSKVSYTGWIMNERGWSPISFSRSRKSPNNIQVKSETVYLSLEGEPQ